MQRSVTYLQLLPRLLEDGGGRAAHLRPRLAILAAEGLIFALLYTNTDIQIRVGRHVPRRLHMICMVDYFACTRKVGGSARTSSFMHFSILRNTSATLPASVCSSDALNRKKSTYRHYLSMALWLEYRRGVIHLSYAPAETATFAINSSILQLRSERRMKERGAHLSEQLVRRGALLPQGLHLLPRGLRQATRALVRLQGTKKSRRSEPEISLGTRVDHKRWVFSVHMVLSSPPVSQAVQRRPAGSSPPCWPLGTRSPPPIPRRPPVSHPIQYPVTHA